MGDYNMTLQESLNMTSEEFKAACKAAEVDYTAFGPIDTSTETLEEAIEDFRRFTSSPESIRAMHEAAMMVP
jgi:hypothetical protein